MSAPEIPSTFLQSAKSWWATGARTSAAAEARLLSRMECYSPETVGSPTSDSPVRAFTSPVQLTTPNHVINTLSLLPANDAAIPSNAAPAVILHGYGAGLGFFFRNFPSLANWVASRKVPIYAVDWLGMGRSSRPAFKVKAKRDDTPARVEQTESFFIDALDQWRQKMGINKFSLIGHSLGGYLSVAYALRYPDHVERLVLLSPAGVPAEPDAEVPTAEVTDPPTFDTNGSADVAHVASASEVKRKHDKQKARRRNQSRSAKLFTYLWEEGWSPFQIVRSTLFFAPMLVGKYSARRFADATEEEIRDLHDYILNITLAKGSGEYSITHLLAPGAMARLPLVHRVAPIKVPITFVYGDHDWMDPEGGYAAVQNLKAAGNRDAKMVVVPNAGHHVYFDNAKVVNDLLWKELDKTVQGRW